MPDFQLIEARPHHCGQMARRLVEEGDATAVSLGVSDTHREMRTCFDGSWYARAWLIDDRIAAIGGLMGTRLSMRGYLWFVLSDLGRKHRFALVRMLRIQIEDLTRSRRELMLAVVADSKCRGRDVRFASFLGFERVPEIMRIGLAQRASLTFRYREAA